MANLTLVDYKNLPENVIIALKERDALIEHQWILIRELEKQLAALQWSHNNFDSSIIGFTDPVLENANLGICGINDHHNHHVQQNSICNGGDKIVEASAKNVVVDADTRKCENDSKTDYDKAATLLQQTFRSYLQRKYSQQQQQHPQQDNNCPHQQQNHHQQQLQQQNISQYQQSDGNINNKDNINAISQRTKELILKMTDNNAGTGEVPIDITSSHFENLLEDINTNDNDDDSFNSDDDANSDIGDDTDDVKNTESSSSSSRNSTLRKKIMGTEVTMRRWELTPPPDDGYYGNIGSGGNIATNNCYANLSQNDSFQGSVNGTGGMNGCTGTLKRDHPSVSRIFSSPSSQSSSSSPPASSPGNKTNNNACQCSECLAAQQQQHHHRHPLFLQHLKTLHNHQQQQQSPSQQNQMQFSPAWTQQLNNSCKQPTVNNSPYSTMTSNLPYLANYNVNHHQEHQQLHQKQIPHNNFNNQQHYNNYMASYNDCFNKLGKIPERVFLMANEDSKPEMSVDFDNGSSMTNLSSCSCDSKCCNHRSSTYYQSSLTLSSTSSSPSSSLFPNHSASSLSSSYFQYPPLPHQLQQHNTINLPHPVSHNHHHHHHHQQYPIMMRQYSESLASHSIHPPSSSSSSSMMLHHPMSHHVNNNFYSQFDGHNISIPRNFNYSSPTANTNNQTVPKLLSDRNRKRIYRVGLNIFNKKPNKGIEYMIDNKFVDPQPNAVARFLISRKGLSRNMIGQYLGSIQDAFSMDVLKCFAEEFDLTGLQIDVALRVFQSQFQISGEAQKIEKFMEVFSSRYRECNPHLVGKVMRSSDTIFLLSFAIIMLNTDLHNKNIKQEKKMSLPDFLKNLKGLDAGGDINSDYLTGIYERVKEQEFIPSPDHTNQVVVLDHMITGKNMSLVETHRRFVCHCRMHEIADLTKMEKIGSHSRGLFLFNDLLIVTKLSSHKKKNSIHRLKQSIPLQGVAVYLLETPYYKHGIRLKNASNDQVIITLCARDQEEQKKFVEDLKESILETEKMDEYMEQLKVRATMTTTTNVTNTNNNSSNNNNNSNKDVDGVNRYSKDSGVVDIDSVGVMTNTQQQQQQMFIKLPNNQSTTSLTHSLNETNENDRRSSRTSVDSGMSSTGSTSNTSHNNTTAITITTTNNTTNITSNNTKLSRTFSQKK